MQKPYSTTGVGIAADLDTINGRLGIYMHECGYAACTIHRHQRTLRWFARWLPRRGRRLATITREDIPHLVRYSALGRCSYCKLERRESLHVWLRCVGRFERAVVSPQWQSWVIDHIEFLATHKGHVASTLAIRKATVTSYLRWQFGSRHADWSRVKPTDVLKFSQEFAQRRMSRLTMKNRLSEVRQFLRFLVLRGAGTQAMVDAVPSVSTFGQPSPRPEVLSEDQRRQLLAAFPRNTPAGKRNYAMTICMLDLGLRLAEVMALRLGSIDWARHQVAVPPVKGGRGRTLPLPRRVSAAIRAYVDRGRPTSKCDHLFVAHPKLSGTPLSTNAARLHITRAFKRCGFPASWRGAHRLRHTFASRLHKRGADLKQIADLLGHRDLESANLYAQIDVSELRPLVQPWPLTS